MPGFEGPGAAFSRANQQNQRRKAVNKRDQGIVADFRKRLQGELEAAVLKLTVYGSRATGNAGPDSDLDLIAIVKDKTAELEGKLDEVAYASMWEFDFRPIISLKVFSESHFQDALERGFSFYRHIESEGISV